LATSDFLLIYFRSVPIYFRLATSDFLLIDSRSASMRHHLRADKVEFWARLVPAIHSVSEIVSYRQQ